MCWDVKKQPSLTKFLALSQLSHKLHFHEALTVPFSPLFFFTLLGHWKEPKSSVSSLILKPDSNTTNSTPQVKLVHYGLDASSYS